LIFFVETEITFKSLLWLGWAYLTKKVPHAATTPIATASKTCISHRKMGF
jgi:hypothetical protein